MLYEEEEEDDEQGERKPSQVIDQRIDEVADDGQNKSTMVILPVYKILYNFVRMHECQDTW